MATATTPPGGQGLRFCAHSGNVLETALALHDAGFWPLPLRPAGESYYSPEGKKIANGKEPSGGAAWGAKCWSRRKLEQHYAERPTDGVGLRLGPKAGLIDVEIDGPEGESSFINLCGGEVVSTLGWDSARGKHRLFVWDDRLAVIKKTKLHNRATDRELPGVEILLGYGQGQAVCPPTLRDDGKPRVWFGEEVAALPECAIVMLLRLATETTATRPAIVTADPLVPANVPLRPFQLRVVNGGDAAWFRSSFEREVQAVESCAEGTRHDRLRNAGLTLFGQVHHGHFTESEVMGALQAAGLACGLQEGEVAETLEWSRQRGLEQPLPLPERLQQSRQRDRPRSIPAGDAGNDLQRDGHALVELTTRRDLVLRDTLHQLPRDESLYDRGGSLVKVTRWEPAPKIGKMVLRNLENTPKIVGIGKDELSCRLCGFIEFFKLVAKDDREEARPAHPPDWLCSTVVNYGHWPGVRQLIGIAEAPFPRPDGTLVCEPGFDDSTGMLFLPSAHFPEVAERPTQADAVQAGKRLLALVELFPFESNCDRVVWLAGVVAMIARPAISGPVPGIAVNGNRPGTGKGLLVDAAAQIALGRDSSTTRYPRDPEETRKTLPALAMAGLPMVHLDNLVEGSAYGSGPLDSALTSTSITERLFGDNTKMVELPLRICWWLSGNNVTPTADAFRRWLPCQLVTPLERPEERAGLPDLREQIRTQRGELVAAVLTILRAHAVAGFPSGPWPPLGSYEQWSRVVRDSIWFATGQDCCATRRVVADASPERAAKIALLKAWYETPRGSGFGMTTREALAIANDDGGGLGEALAFWESRDGKLPTARELGKLLASLKNQNHGGLKFHAGEHYKGAIRWSVLTCTE